MSGAINNINKLRHQLSNSSAPMRREKPEWIDSIRARVPMRGTGTELVVVGMKGL